MRTEEAQKAVQATWPEELMAEDRKYAFVGVGGNLGSPRRQVLSGIERMTQLKRCWVTSRSSLYRSAPLGFIKQPDFINAVIKLFTTFNHTELLDQLLAIETEFGRIRSGQANEPRPLDLDLLLYEGESCDTPQLVLPHPRMHVRRFVLEPLLEIAPNIEIPNRGRAIDCLAACSHQQVAKLS